MYMSDISSDTSLDGAVSLSAPLVSHHFPHNWIISLMRDINDKNSCIRNVLN